MIRLSRKEFLISLGAAQALGAGPDRPPKVLLVVAHPDDEYTFAGSVYRIAKEFRGTVDQVVITNGAAGYRYSELAEQFYQANLTREDVGRARLPEIRRRETLAAGRILGIRRHYFLGQADTRYTLDPEEAMRAWDTRAVDRFLSRLLERERYEYVFTLLPTPETHGHHQAATLLALRAVETLAPEARPVVLGGDPARASDPVRAYAGSPPVLCFHRDAKFGFHESLSYQIVVNWVIAEHKSQGLFQTDCNKHDEERFWMLRTESASATRRIEELGALLTPKRP
jgi:LmbE family N-acetylglucosaminyl deacetylase